MSAEFFDNKLESGSILYPELEAVRYVVREQKKEIDRLKSENKRLEDALGVLKMNFNKAKRCPDNTCDGCFEDMKFAVETIDAAIKNE